MKQLEKFNIFKKRVDYVEMLSDAFLSFLNDVFKTTPLKISKLEDSIIIANQGLEGRITISKKSIGIKTFKDTQFVFTISSYRNNPNILALEEFLKEIFNEYFYAKSKEKTFFEIPNEDIPEVIKKLNSDEFEFYIAANKYNL